MFENPRSWLRWLTRVSIAPALVAGAVTAQASTGTRPRDERVRPELRWRPQEWMTTKRGHAIAYDPGRKVVVCFGGAEQCPYDTWEWDGTTWEQRLPPHSPTGRDGHCLAYDPVRKTVLLFGGFHYRSKTYLNDTWEWDGSDWRQLKPATTPASRTLFSMATDFKRSKIVMYGGVAQNPTRTLGDTWLWNGTNWLLQSPKTRPKTRSSHASCFNPLTGRVAMFGGYVAWPILGDNEIYEWDGADWVHLPQTTRPSSWANNVFAFDPSLNRVILNCKSPPNTENWAWDGRSWTKLAPKTALPYHPWWATATDTSRKQMVVFGYSDDRSVDLGAETWTFANGDWKQIHVYTGQPTFCRPLEWAHDEARDQTLFMGLSCLDNSDPQPEYQMWAHRDDRWVRLTPKTMPSTRQGEGGIRMLYYEREQKVVLFGGLDLNNKMIEDIWVWDGTDWSAHPLSKAPGQPRIISPLVYDRRRGVVVRYPADGVQWEWDFQKGWLRRSPKTLPPQTYVQGRVTYDWARGLVVLQHQWGLARTEPPYWRGEVWEYDGVDWRKSPVEPPEKVGNVGYSDAVGGLLFLPSGQTAAGEYDKHCWAYDGTSWQRLPLDIEPYRVGRESGDWWALIYDPNRRRLGAFAFGGWVDNEFARHNLLPSVRYPRPGQDAVLEAVYPNRAGQGFWWCLSTSSWPGIPLGRDHIGVQMLPLGRSPLLDLTVGAGLVSQLNRWGKGEIRIPIPSSPAFVGARFFAAGIVVGTKGIEEISNSVELEVIK